MLSLTEYTLCFLPFQTKFLKENKCFFVFLLYEPDLNQKPTLTRQCHSLRSSSPSAEALDRYSSVQEPHDGAIVCMEVVGQRLIVSCSKDSTVRVGDVETGEIRLA